MECINRSLVNLKDYQSKVIKYFMLDKVDGIMLVHSTGSGKTITSIALSQCFLDKYPRRKVIIVAPASVLMNFRKEMNNYGVKNKEKYHLFSFQKFLNLSQEGKSVCSKNDLLIIDEAHELRNMSVNSNLKGLRAKALLECSKVASKRLLLTATPYYNNKEDFISLINLLYGGVILRAPKQLKDINSLKKYLKGRVDYIPSEKNKKGYPQFREHVVKIAMSKEYEEKYCKLIQGFRVNDIRFNNPKSFYNAHRRAVNKLGGSEKYFSLKMDEALKIIKNYKSVIFSNWLDFGVQPISKSLDKHGISNEIFYGGIDEDEKERIIKDFNEDKFQVLVISGAGKQGLDLKGVRKMVVMDPVWNHSGMEQIKGRVIRYNSHAHLPSKDRTVGIYYLLLVTDSKDCLSGDSILYKIIEDKKKEGEKFDQMLKEVSISKI